MSQDKKNQNASSERKEILPGKLGRTHPQKDSDHAQSRKAMDPRRPEEEEINDINEQEDEDSDRPFEDPQRDQDRSSRRLEQPPRDLNATNVR